MTEWVACVNYGGRNIVQSGQNAVFPLMTMPDYSVVDPHALEDDALSGDFMLLRVVGQVYLNPGINSVADAEYIWGWRLMTLPLDLATGLLEVPWSVNDSPLQSSDISNEPRWLAERWMVSGPISLGVPPDLEPLRHPFWTHLDWNGKALCGPHSGEYPCLVVDNTLQNLSEADAEVTWRLRLLVQRDGRRS